MISPIIVDTVGTLISYAQVVLLFAIGYFGFRLFTHETDEEKRESEERTKKVGEWVKEKAKEQAKNKEQKARRDKVNFVKSALIKAIEHGEDLVAALHKGKNAVTKPGAVRVAEKELKELHENLNSAISELRRIKRKESGAVLHFFDELRAECQNIYRRVESVEIPAATDLDWTVKVDSVEKVITTAHPPLMMSVTAACDAIRTSLDKYIETGEIK